MTPETVTSPSAARPLVPWPFLGLLGLGGLAACVGYVALVLCTATWAEARALDTIFSYNGWHIRSFSAAEFAQVRTILSGTALVLAAGWVGLGPATRTGRRQLAATAREVAQAGQRLKASWRALPRGQRWVALGVLLALTALRAYLSTALLPYGDDGVSYELFVRHQLLAVAAYYPIPNNHLLANTLSWMSYQVYPSFWGAMRLPVLLTSTLGTALLFGCLLRRAGYRVALVATGLFSCLQLSLYYASNGRGYWLVMLLAGVVFWCLLHLLGPVAASARNDRAAWLGLFVAGVLGCYAVPTFAYVLASAFSWLGGQALRRHAWGLLARAVVVGGLVGAGVAVLYVPVLLVSGAAALLDNDFMYHPPLAAFWRALPGYAWRTESFLGGQHRVGAVVTVVGLGLFGHLWYRAATGRLSAGSAQRVRRLGLPALWFVLLPYGLLAGQRVLAPERTLLYKAWFFFILVALVAENTDWRPARRRWLAGAVSGLFVLYQLVTVVRLNYGGRGSSAGQRAAYAWLVRHPAAEPVLVPDYKLWLWLRLHAHVQAPSQPWLAEYSVQPGVRYSYLVTHAHAPRPAQAGSVVWATSECLIYNCVATVQKK